MARPGMGRRRAIRRFLVGVVLLVGGYLAAPHVASFAGLTDPDSSALADLGIEDDGLVGTSTDASKESATDYVTTEGPWEPAGPTDMAQSEPVDWEYLFYLRDWCRAGDGSACDELFAEAPIGGSLERFGVSCGERPSIVDCGAELTDVSRPPMPSRERVSGPRQIR